MTSAKIAIVTLGGFVCHQQMQFPDSVTAIPKLLGQKAKEHYKKD